jgi:hypothetical protein
MDSQRHAVKFNSVLLAAKRYRDRGWAVIPVPYRTKKPVITGWERLRLSDHQLGHYFGGRPQNIGVLLGKPSGGLIDIDLDHPLAVEIAPRHLPPTGAVFGRASKPQSHWLYVSGTQTAMRQWRLPNKQMVVELRSTGGQTVFPGSVHSSGEPIEWDCDGEPALVESDWLQACLQKIYDEVCRRMNVSGAQFSRTEKVINHTAPARVIDRARRYLAKLPRAVSGEGGHASTFRAACLLAIGFGLDRDESLQLLREWNARCQPPWSEKELEHKVDDAMKQPGWRGYLLTKWDRTRLAIPTGAVERATRHAIEHRRRMRRRVRA